MNEFIYLDYMASTPLDPRVLEAMQASIPLYANPSALHQPGREAAQSIERARAQVADSIRAKPDSLIWTSGATESNNLALQGAARFYSRQGKHIITLQSEHKAVLSVMAMLENQGFEVSYLAPLSNGLIDWRAFEAAFRPDTILVSVMWVNNETGVIQPIDAIADRVKCHGALLHVDATQALGKVAIDLEKTHIDLLTLAAHKYYGPKGVGVLYIRQEPLVRLSPLMAGSGQEGSIRPGTVATQLAVGMGAACRLIVEQEAECQRISALKERLMVGLKSLPGVYFYSDDESVVSHCIALRVEGISMSALLACLPDLIIATGSACNSATPEPSVVLLSMGFSPSQAENSCRISLGRYTTASEIDQVIHRFSEELLYLRSVSPDCFEMTNPRKPYQHAYCLKNATHKVRWSSLTERVRFLIYARIDDTVEELSFMLDGSSAWFALLNDFCAKLAGSPLSQLQCLDKETLMQLLGVSVRESHRIHALLACVKELLKSEGTRD